MAKARALLAMLCAIDAKGRNHEAWAVFDNATAPSALGAYGVCGTTRGGDGGFAEWDPLRGASADLALRLEAMADAKGFRAKRVYDLNRNVLDRIKAEIKRLTRAASDSDAGLSPAAMTALAYPDRIGRCRKGDQPRFMLFGCKGAALEAEASLAAAPFLVALNLDGNPREAKNRMAAGIGQREIREMFSDRIAWDAFCACSKRERRVVARRRERFGAILLDDRVWKDVPEARVAEAMLDGVRDVGLRIEGAALGFAGRDPSAGWRGFARHG